MRILEIELQDDILEMLEELQEQFTEDTGKLTSDESMISGLIRNGHHEHCEYCEE